MVYTIIIALALTAFLRWNQDLEAIHKDSHYLKLELLADEAMFENNELVRSMDDKNPESIGSRPLLIQVETNQAFAELAKVAKVTPAKFVSLRVRQMLKDGPRKLIELPKAQAGED